MKLSKLFLYCLICFILTIAIVWAIRFFSESQLDDVTPGIPCDEDLMKKVDVFYVIPNFNGSNISEDKEWCQYILSFGKDIRLHGFVHTFNEFNIDKDEEYVESASQIFEDCFNQTPTRFKPPQVEMTDKNKILIKNSMVLDGLFNQFFHKVYHCNDSGIPFNRFNDLF